eukprot:CAMPEP_0181219558 /NCGR_PEP_ID=MMETSP1096-20121128/28349_1 /TAXON_ID=156174 ORGANISM="Chrysochromulina ericina, Strain CCMP281" /NCGR_SAMPLE_ID=MMETSP1096 /ASSEMBLY_ACC=CAM_ASM_000453 /LENGTH=87 /DNA_ID=CAMNT_0023311965 /DNA_START=285 /DNA_END=548 /DNA_ORIENTATION=+
MQVLGHGWKADGSAQITRGQGHGRAEEPVCHHTSVASTIFSCVRSARVEHVRGVCAWSMHRAVSTFDECTSLCWLLRVAHAAHAAVN